MAGPCMNMGCMAYDRELGGWAHQAARSSRGLAADEVCMSKH
jgi:hypothetical protein